MRVIAIILTLLTILSINGKAQQDPLFAQYHLNASIINPAYSGIHNRFSINTNFRRQWNGLLGSPETNLLTINSSIIPNKVGGGILISHDQIGITTTIESKLMASYQIQMSKNQIFSFGLIGGVTAIAHDQNQLELKYLDDPEFPQVKQRASAPDFGAGISMLSDNYYLGLSVSRLLQADFNDGLINGTVFKRHFYLQGSFIHDLGPNFKIKPGALIKYISGTPISYDLSLSALYNNQVWFGAYTRDLGSFGFLAQFVLNEAYRLGYAIEFPTGNQFVKQFLTHEITLGIDLSLLNSQQVFIRYF